MKIRIHIHTRSYIWILCNIIGNCDSENSGWQALLFVGAYSVSLTTEASSSDISDKDKCAGDYSRIKFVAIAVGAIAIVSIAFNCIQLIHCLRRRSAEG